MLLERLLADETIGTLRGQRFGCPLAFAVHNPKLKLAARKSAADLCRQRKAERCAALEAGQRYICARFVIANELEDCASRNVLGRVNDESRLTLKIRARSVRGEAVRRIAAKGDARHGKRGSCRRKSGR